MEIHRLGYGQIGRMLKTYARARLPRAPLPRRHTLPPGLSPHPRRRRDAKALCRRSCAPSSAGGTTRWCATSSPCIEAEGFRIVPVGMAVPAAVPRTLRGAGARAPRTRTARPATSVGHFAPRRAYSNARCPDRHRAGRWGGGRADNQSPWEARRRGHDEKARARPRSAAVRTEKRGARKPPGSGDPPSKRAKRGLGHAGRRSVVGRRPRSRGAERAGLPAAVAIERRAAPWPSARRPTAGGGPRGLFWWPVSRCPAGRHHRWRGIGGPPRRRAHGGAFPGAGRHVARRRR